MKDILYKDMEDTLNTLLAYTDNTDDPLGINKDNQGSLSVGCKNNIVSKESLRKVQYSTLNEIANALRQTFGPKGSNSLILTGTDANTLVANYSKDGRKCLNHILYNNPIELSIQTQLKDIVAHVDKQIGDGTTSATLLSNAIFKRLCSEEKNRKENNMDIPPYEIMRNFQKAVKYIQDRIKYHKRDFTLQDVYDIAYISTNGNTEVASQLKDIYKEYGLDVYIETSISNTEESHIKIYDGLTLDEGYSDAAYINTTNGKCSIYNANIYAFMDPIDTTDMVALFESIIYKNILFPLMNPDEYDYDPVPTVILSPKISRDMSEVISNLVNQLYNYDSKNIKNMKPPILIVTNLLGGNMDKYFDIARLCGCKMIKKYIDHNLQDMAIKKGEAPTPENINEFAGKCDLVEADISMTKFINPKDMYEKDDNGNVLIDKNDKPTKTPTFNNLLSFLEAELQNAIDNNEDDREKYRIRQRIQSLKANLIEYEVGGISISDRDSVKDLVEDAVKSCRSAYKDGVGYGANYEGLRASIEVASNINNLYDNDNVYFNILDMIKLIALAYIDVARILYSTETNTPDEVIIESLKQGKPLNIRKGIFDDKVITSIDTDIYILDAISKIVTLMFTSTQAILQVPALNRYES